MQANWRQQGAQAVITVIKPPMALRLYDPSSSRHLCQRASAEKPQNCDFFVTWNAHPRGNGVHSRSPAPLDHRSAVRSQGLTVRAGPGPHWRRCLLGALSTSQAQGQPESMLSMTRWCVTGETQSEEPGSQTDKAGASFSYRRSGHLFLSLDRGAWGVL